MPIDMKTQHKKPMPPLRRITYRMIIASLLAVMIAARLGGGIVAASPTMCVASAETLSQAKADYAASCEAPRVDCDQISGLWYCSDQIIGERAPGGLTSDNPMMPVIEDPAATETPDAPATVMPEPSATDQPIDGVMPCIASSESLDQARSNFAANCDTLRVDCDPIDGRWYCSDRIIGERAPGGLTATDPTTPIPATPIPPEPTPIPPTPQPPTPVPPTPQPTSVVPGNVHPDIVKVIDVDGRNPGGLGWADSYSVGDQCFCATTFDHNIGPITVDTPNGPRTVRQVCNDLGPGPGLFGRPIYNDVQCGNGPANDAGDEDDCPGRVDIGRDGCGQIGPRWNFGSNS